jgi:hypothetical protein
VLRVAAAVLLLSACWASAQKAPATPPVRVNILNVCAPSEAEQKEIAGALARLPRHPSFGRDYEVARGRTTADDGRAADWVRIRREYLSQSPLRAVQFSFSVDAKDNRETLVFYSRETKGVIQVALEDQVAAGTAPAVVLAADTPVNHIRIERFGKPSLVLARCPQADQTAYEPLFRSASQIMAAYRTHLQARRMVPAELGRLIAPAKSKARR